MSGKKVFELARDLNMKSKELLDFLKTLGITASTHMSVLEESSIAMIRERLNKKVHGTGKASESFKEIKGTPKTILIKKKPRVEETEGAQPAGALHEAAAEKGIEEVEKKKRSLKKKW
ncbi:MAG: translation initiation factor IF-2 N-terminal domain-containing protein [Nitrospirota bacterium]